MSGGSGPSTALPMASPTNSGAAARKPRQASLSSSLNIRIAVFLTAFADYANDWHVQNSTTHSSAQKRSFPPSLEMKAQCPPDLGAPSGTKGFSSIPESRNEAMSTSGSSGDASDSGGTWSGLVAR